jgi:3-keto-disaccharide hydrolase
MSAQRTVSCMRLDWGYRSHRAAFFAALFLPTLVAQQNSVSIFDGKTLKGWDGDPAYWRVENGAIVGETKPGAIPKQNTFLIWRGGSPSDFELRAEYRLTVETAAFNIGALSCLKFAGL